MKTTNQTSAGYVPFELRSKSTFGRKSAQCHHLNVNVHVSARRQISSHVQSVQDEAEAADDAVFSFHSSEVTRRSYITCCFSSKYKAMRQTFAVVNAKSVFLVKCY